MADTVLLRVDGDVDSPLALSWADLAGLVPARQVSDVGQIVPGRQGGAFPLDALLEACRPRACVRYLTLHASRDDFHATVPLEAIATRAWLIYRQGDEPLPVSSGGPVRFLIRDPAACRTQEVDECASVKYVDRLEFSAEPGADNRPADERAHARIHAKQNPRS